MTDISQISELTLDEKARLTAGVDVWTVPGIERLGLPPLRMTDGPNGARGSQLFDGSVPALCMPCGSALGATFDADLIERVGAVLGNEARQKRSRVLLAPTINLVRSPLFGRSFECYSEDPWLTGSLAAAFVRGVQAQGVATTPKHLVGNETEYQRQTINSIIDERTLREVYLAPFEWAIRHGGALGVMTAYNRLNGTYCSEDAALLTGILRDEWGFEGFVVSDWFAAGSTVGSLEAGLDVQMPGPDRFFGAPVAAAVADGEVDASHLDEIVRRRLHLHQALDAWEDDTTEAELGIEHPDDRKVAHETAVASMVLLSNDGLLPLADDVGSIALIGPNAVTGHIMGGGSAQLVAHRRTSPADAMAERLGDRLTVEPGCVIDKIAPALRPDAPFEVEFFSSDDWSGPVVAQSDVASGRAIWVGEPAPGLGTDPFTARMTGTLTPRTSGLHTFTLIQAGGARVLIGGVAVLDGIANTPPPGSAFFGLGSAEMVCEIELAADETVDVIIEFGVRGGTSIRGVAVGHKPPVPADLFQRAVASAAAADVAIVVVGTSREWETEGTDRTSIDLPGEQVELIEAVCAANQRTCVVVNAGAPVAMDWVDRPAAVLQAWLGGQEMAPALDQVLFGDAEPGGRLPVTIPKAVEHTPAYGNFPGENNETRYGEGLLIGYRWYDTKKLPVRFPFGHGLSYTTFDWAPPVVTRTGPAGCSVQVAITNTGSRVGSEVVQLYVEPPQTGLFRPRSELHGVAKLRLEPGQTKTATIVLSPRSFAHWDPVNTDHIELREKMAGAAELIPSGGGDQQEVTAAGWYVAAGEYRLRLGRSILDVVHNHRFHIDQFIGPLTTEESLP